MNTEITPIPTAQIVPGNNDRKVFDQAKLRELAASIEAHGLAQPITVRPLGSQDLYQIVAGERRFRAVSQILEWETIPCIVRELTDEQASAVMLTENTGRADLNPIEEAMAYEERATTFGWTNEYIAKIAGVSVNRVKNRRSLLTLIDEVKHLVAGGHFPIGHAEAMVGLDKARQLIAMRIYRESKNGLPLTHFREIVGQLMEEQSQDSLFDLETFWIEQMQKQAELPRRGKRAITGAPTRKDLPQIEMGPKDSAAAVIDRYIAELMKSGLNEEAATLGTVYTALVRGNYMSVPGTSFLAKP